MRSTRYALLLVAICLHAFTSMADEIKVPPRTVDDIIKVLDKSSQYEAEFIEAKKWTSKLPPESASP